MILKMGKQFFKRTENNKGNEFIEKRKIALKSKKYKNDSPYPYILCIFCLMFYIIYILEPHNSLFFIVLPIFFYFV